MSPANSRSPVFPKRTFRNMVLPHTLWLVPLTPMMDDRSLHMKNFSNAGGINHIHARKIDVFPCCVTITVTKHWNNLKLLEWQIVEYLEREIFYGFKMCFSVRTNIFRHFIGAIKLWNYYYYYYYYYCALCHCYHRPCRHCYVRCDHVTETSSSIKLPSVLTSKDTSNRSRRAVLPGVSHCLFVLSVLIRNIHKPFRNFIFLWYLSRWLLSYF